MQMKKFNSRVLRDLAERVVEGIAEDGDVFEAGRPDLVTSLVRQWITYNGNATLILGEQQVYLVLGRTPLGGYRVTPEPGLLGWVGELTRDWKVRPDDLPDAIDQLNLGQSAEVVNGDGVPLRLWVDPRERGRGVEPLVREAPSPGAVRDDRKVAADELRRQVGVELGPEELDELASSVATQWRRYDGHASVFVDGREEYHFTITGRSEGGCEVVTRRLGVDLGGVLAARGVAPDDLPEVIARFNLGQEVGVRDGHGASSLLWHDPKARRICVRPLDLAPPPPAAVDPPFFCPHCTAVLPPGREGEGEQSCPLCGGTIPIC